MTKKLLPAIFLALFVLLFCASCTSYEVRLEPREGFYFYDDWFLSHPGGYCTGMGDEIIGTIKLGRFVSRYHGKEYVGTSVTHYVPLKDSRVRFYDSKTGGNEIPRNYKLTDSITVYVEFID